MRNKGGSTPVTVQQKPAAVTTGPVIGSRKIHSCPEGRPDLRVPFREIDLHPSANEPPFRIYDTSGPYTDPAARIDLEAGLTPLRSPWLERRGLAPVAPRGEAGGQRQCRRGQTGGGMPGAAHRARRHRRPAGHPA